MPSGDEAAFRDIETRHERIREAQARVARRTASLRMESVKYNHAYAAIMQGIADRGPPVTEDELVRLDALTRDAIIRWALVDELLTSMENVE